MIRFLLSSMILISSIAEARAGGGRSMGVSRSYSRPSPSVPRYSPPVSRPAPVQPAQPPRNRSSDILTGAAVGAAAGYMVASSGNAHAETIEPIIPCKLGFERETYDGKGVCVVD